MVSGSKSNSIIYIFTALFYHAPLHFSEKEKTNKKNKKKNKKKTDTHTLINKAKTHNSSRYRREASGRRYLSKHNGPNIVPVNLFNIKILQYFRHLQKFFFYFFLSCEVNALHFLLTGMFVACINQSKCIISDIVVSSNFAASSSSINVKFAKKLLFLKLFV